VTTVSHVLNNTPHRPVAPETRKRVLEIAQKLNYYADAAARRLARSRSDLFGLILFEIANPFFSDVIEGFQRAVLKRGFDFLLWNTEYDQERLSAGVRKLIENKVRGVAVVTSMIDRSSLVQLASRDILVVLLGSGPAEPWISQIDVTSQGMSEAVDHLLGLGHEQIAFVSGPPNIHSATRVRDSFLETIQERHVAPCRMVASNYRVDGGESAVRALLGQSSFPTAIVCGNDLIALGVISALEQNSIKVPEQVSVVGNDDILYAQLAHPPLTTVHVPRKELGRLAFGSLERMLRSNGGKGRVDRVSTQLIMRKSTTTPCCVNLTQD